MNWEAIGAIGEMIGAVGVILTLGYLAFQIRQNTEQLAQNERRSIAEAVNVSTTSYRENRRFIYMSAELSEIMLKGMADPERLSETDLDPVQIGYSQSRGRASGYVFSNCGYGLFTGNLANARRQTRRAGPDVDRWALVLGKLRQ